MTWHWPHALWLLLVPLALVLWELTRRVRASAKPLPKVLRAEALPGRLALSGETQRPVRPKFRWRMWLGLSLTVVALARPQWGEIEEQVFDQAREILIAVDLSRSMLAPDVPPSRLERARLLITGLLEQLEGERVGLMVFAGTAFLQSPLSADYEILREFLPALEPDFLPQGGTDYAAMLQTALDAFGKEEGADRFLIVLSDGESQTDAWEPLVKTLDERGIKVIGLGIGTADGAMLPDGEGGFVKDERGAVVLSRLNPSTLEELARRTGGVYRDASTWVDLAAVVEDTVAAGRQGEFAEVNRVRRVERFQWPLAPALLLFLLSYWREFPVHPRSRNLPLQTQPTQPARPAAQTVTQTVATAFALLAVLGASAIRLPAQPQENPFAAPLRETVARLSSGPAPTAKDYAELAKTTVTYGERLLSSQQRPEPGVVSDALEAVDVGEAMNADAADWDELRRQLEALRPPEEQQQQEQPEQQPQENQESDDSQESSQSGEQQQQEPQSQDGQQDQQPQDSDASQSSENSSQDNQQQQPRDPSQQPAPSAFGDMGPEENGPKREEPVPQNTQQVGGQSERSFEERRDPALAVPLQKLDDLRRQDSPAELYQLMQDPNARPTEKGRDW